MVVKDIDNNGVTLKPDMEIQFCIAWTLICELEIKVYINEILMILWECYFEEPAIDILLYFAWFIHVKWNLKLSDYT